MKSSRYAAAWLLCSLLTGCASLGFITPQSLDERLGAAYTSNTAVRDAVATSLDSHALSSDDGAYALAQTRENRKLLDAARVVAGSGDVATAEGRLALVLNSLTVLRSHLEKQGVKVQEKP